MEKRENTDFIAKRENTDFMTFYDFCA